MNIVPKWDTLKALTNSKLSRLTIAVPAVGWILVYNNEIIRILQKKYDIDLSELFSWQMHAFYLGLILISITAIIYIVACPKEIKQYSSMLEYAISEKKLFTPEFDKTISAEIRCDPLNWKFPSQAFADTNGKYPLARLHETNEEAISNKLQKNYITKNDKLLLIRSVVIVIFLFGTVLVLVPTINTVGWSFCTVVKHTVPDGWADKLKNSCSMYLNGTKDHLKNMKQPIIPQISVE